MTYHEKKESKGIKYSLISTIMVIIFIIMMAMNTFAYGKKEISTSSTPNTNIYYSLLNENGSISTNGTITPNPSTAMDWFWVIVKSIYFNAIMSGLFAGAVTIFVTVIIERFGPQIGGVIATLVSFICEMVPKLIYTKQPSAIVPALIGFAFDANRNYETDEENRRHVLIQQFFSVPIAVFCNITMMVVWKYGPTLLNWIISKIHNKKQHVNNKETFNSSGPAVSLEDHFKEHHDDHLELKEVDLNHDKENLVDQKVEETKPNKHELLKKIGKMLIVCFLSLIAWFVVAAVFVVVTKIVKLSDDILMGVSMGFYGLTIISSLIFNWKQPTTKPGPAKKVAWWLLLSRGILACVIICISVLMGGLKLTFISGMFSVFPVISLSSLISLWLSQGEIPTSNASSTMMVGSNSLPIFAAVMCVCLWYMNIALAFLVGYVASALVAVLCYAYLWWRKKVALSSMVDETKLDESKH
ncbi:predicted protein [Naegleria gruberi]|uniref:Predicted protein n=1 Tax=Naegleria gruberi TaxID=5762 RepID=D2W2V0_NAEGR|nr:uncharacterized protein NAEGRDRAFT_54280 [Naegleria gruberi]EFC36578.1 predicted protein [Naegleria gruberi]|eukprot:XP_002669322.1 predicted protein [Naegleria gruberi strain NEG-M]